MTPFDQHPPDTNQLAHSLELASFFLPYRQKDKWGFCMPDKSIVIPCNYEKVFGFIGDTAIVQKHGRYGAINRTGILYIPCRYTSLETAVSEIYQDKYVILSYFEKAINEKGSKLLFVTYPSKVESQKTLQYGNVLLQYYYGKYQIICPVVSTLFYQEVKQFSTSGKNSLLWLKFNNKWGAVDQKGMQVIPCIYDTVELFNENYPKYVWVMVNGKRGIISNDNVQYWEG